MITGKVTHDLSNLKLLAALEKALARYIFKFEQDDFCLSFLSFNLAFR
jgi:hypothetical protein